MPNTGNGFWWCCCAAACFPFWLPAPTCCATVSVGVADQCSAHLATSPTLLCCDHPGLLLVNTRYASQAQAAMQGMHRWAVQHAVAFVATCMHRSLHPRRHGGGGRSRLPPPAGRRSRRRRPRLPRVRCSHSKRPIRPQRFSRLVCPVISIESSLASSAPATSAPAGAAADAPAPPFQAPGPAPPPGMAPPPPPQLPPLSVVPPKGPAVVRATAAAAPAPRPASSSPPRLELPPASSSRSGSG